MTPLPLSSPFTCASVEAEAEVEVEMKAEAADCSANGGGGAAAISGGPAMRSLVAAVIDVFCKSFGGTVSRRIERKMLANPPLIARRTKAIRSAAAGALDGGADAARERGGDREELGEGKGDGMRSARGPTVDHCVVFKMAVASAVDGGSWNWKWGSIKND